MKRPAVVDRKRARRPAQFRFAGRIETACVIVRQAPGPMAIRAVLIMEWFLVALRQYHQRTLIVITVIKIKANSQRTVVRMWPELDVLMPFDFFTTVSPFEIQLRVMKLDVRADQVCHNIRDHWA